jgi:transmembrane sensor
MRDTGPQLAADRSLTQEMGRLRADVMPAWSDTRQKAVEKALLRKIDLREQRRRRARLFVLVAAAAAVMVTAKWSVFSRPLAHDAAVRDGDPPSLVLGDGSSVTPDPGSDVRWMEVGPTRVSATLRAGRARFDVTHVDGRVFRVEAGPVAVQVLGTAFVVDRVSDRASRVSVERGKVRVFWSGGQRDLSEGEAGLFPPPGSAPFAGGPPVVSVDAGGIGAVAEGPVPPPQPTGRPASAWRNLAQGGAFDEAYVALKREGGSVAVRDEVNDLLLAADVARLSHHPAEAVEPLRQILRLHASDPRASLAAFTLGRVLLESLGEPREAADAFAEVRALAPGGELLADALARETEARAAAGDMETARTLAERYVKDFPTGARLRSVRRYGGLE